jgi:phytoene dehydrogenase-like protein
VVDGFQLDRGFQVLFTAYPEAQRQLDLSALSLERFDRGVLVRVGGRFHRLADPFRGAGVRGVATGALDATRAPIGALPDKIRMARLRRELLGKPAADLLRGPDLSTATSLRERGFSDSTIDRFFRPLFGGIQLDQSLTTSSRVFDVMFRTLASSDAALPANGMGAIPAQLAAHLPEGAYGSDVAPARSKARPCGSTEAAASRPRASSSRPKARRHRGSWGCLGALEASRASGTRRPWHRSTDG